jgi:hypothetical protein
MLRGASTPRLSEPTAAVSNGVDFREGHPESQVIRWVRIMACASKRAEQHLSELVSLALGKVARKREV